MRILKIYNAFLSLSVILLGLYIFITPYKPELDYIVNQHKFDAVIDAATKPKESQPIAITKENKLTINSIMVDGIVHEGGKEAMDKGLWRRPHTSTPDKGGNTVIVAHRFLFKEGPNTFYHLDKVKKGEEFTLSWNKKLYKYRVFDIKEVYPTEIEIEKNTKEPIVTLYTCAPLFTALKRLVIQAKLIHTYE